MSFDFVQELARNAIQHEIFAEYFLSGALRYTFVNSDLGAALPHTSFSL